MTKEVREFILKHKKLINENRFDIFFMTAHSTFTSSGCKKFCEALSTAGIDFIKYMSFIPTGFMLYSDEKTYKIPNNITVICPKAFAISDLETMIIPKQVVAIQEDAFSYCEQLTDVTIEEGCRTIGEGCFRYCLKLQNLILPSTLLAIPEHIIEGCESLQQITYNGTIDEWNNLTGNQYCRSVHIKCSDGVIQSKFRGN